MIYKTPDDLTESYMDHPGGMNEARADAGEAALTIVSDCNADQNPADCYLDMSDALACLRHTADRLGLDWSAMVDKADRAYHGDMEDGPAVARDLVRFPDDDTPAPFTRPVVVVVRHPDAENHAETWAGEGEPYVVHVDMGASFDGTPDDWETWRDWADCFDRFLAELGEHPAADYLRETVSELEPDDRPETCPVCGQPDNCGDCDHTPAS